MQKRNSPWLGWSRENIFVIFLQERKSRNEHTIIIRVSTDHKARTWDQLRCVRFLSQRAGSLFPRAKERTQRVVLFACVFLHHSLCVCLRCRCDHLSFIRFDWQEARRSLENRWVGCIQERRIRIFNLKRFIRSSWKRLLSLDACRDTLCLKCLHPDRVNFYVSHQVKPSTSFSFMVDLLSTGVTYSLRADTHWPPRFPHLVTSVNI